jgi:hypothetical protein
VKTRAVFIDLWQWPAARYCECRNETSGSV